MSQPAKSDDSKDSQHHLILPSPIPTRRTRTNSTIARALENQEKGRVRMFCREKGHGFITCERTGEDIFVHISDIEGEFVPLPGDEVEFRLCPIPPKFEKHQAVHVNIIHLTPEVHKKWDGLTNKKCLRQRKSNKKGKKKHLEVNISGLIKCKLFEQGNSDFFI